MVNQALAIGVVAAALAACAPAGATDDNALDRIATRYAGAPVSVECVRMGGLGEAFLAERTIRLAARATCAPLHAGPSHRGFPEAFQTLLHEASHFVVPTRGYDYEYHTDCRAMRLFKGALRTFFGIRGARADAMYAAAWRTSYCREWKDLPTYGSD